MEVLTLPYNGQVDWWSHLQKFSNFVLITLPLKLSPRFFPDLIGNLHTSDIFVFFFQPAGVSGAPRLHQSCLHSPEFTRKNDAHYAG